MNRKIWEQEYFKEGLAPAWPCPVCRGGTLTLKEDSLRYELTGQSIKAQKHGYWEPEWDSFRVTAFFECQYCQDNIALVGIGENKFVGGRNRPLPPDELHETRFYPLYIIPFLNIIDCPVEILQSDKLKTAILMELEKAFSLFWCDNEACANKLRNVVERILNQQKVSRVHKPAGKKEQLIALHRRIEAFKQRGVNGKSKVVEDVADHLLAIKFIGNPGSHAQTVSRSAVLDAFEIIEHCLKKLYDNEDLRITKLSRQIIKKRAPLS